MLDDLLWIEAGRRFRPEELVFWQGQGRLALTKVAAGVDTLVLGPHASAAFPAELRPHISPTLSRRKQCDYSDCLTATLGRAWAAADAGVVYIENPVSRLVQDANRAPPADALGGLQEFFRRLHRQRAGEAQSFGGVDAIRPITFSGEDVLLEPASHAEWQALGELLHDAAERTVTVYRACCEQVLELLLEKRPPTAALRVISLHDTMNTKMRADGAIVVERPPEDRLPDWMNLGNRGDEQGDEAGEPLSLSGAELRRIAQAWGQALGLGEDERQRAIRLNKPYKGAYETQHFGARLRPLGKPQIGALQLEFRREALLDAAALARLHGPGQDWPAPETAHLQGIALALAHAGQALRRSST
ncbi:MAG: N-formylglutamate amidohydrolase [Roseateles sp.]